MDEIEKKSIDFEKVLKTAQKLGYAEKDPTFDVEGIDAAHKLAILSLLVFKKLPNLSGMHVRGVSEVTLYDIKTARDFGYKIKLLAICSNQNSFECSVEPWLISKDHSLAKIDGVLNAIEINSNLAGPLLLTGAGAGSKPTASAVMSDVFDCLAGGNRTGLLRNGDKINQVSNSKSFKSEVKFYLRVSVIDKVGILSDLTSIFKTFKISIETIYQDSALAPTLSIARNLFIGREPTTFNIGKFGLLDRAKMASESLDAIKRVELDLRSGDELVENLSGGERRRVEISRTLAIDPDFILLDEPLGALDKKLRDEMQIELRNLQKAVGITFVFVTHDQGESISMSDRVAVMNEGKVHQIDTPINLLQKPKTLFVSSFILGNNIPVSYTHHRAHET